MNGYKSRTEALWRRRIRQQQAGELTVCEYCDAHDLSESSFYTWRKKLKSIDERAEATRNPEDAAGSAGLPMGPFFSVRLPAAPANVLEIVHPSGCQIRVPADFQPQVLRDVLAVLDSEEE